MSEQSDLFYRYHVFCCLNKRPAGHERGCCLDRGHQPLFNYMKARVKELNLDRVRVNKAGCLDRCEEGPVMVIYPEGVWYRAESQSDIDRIIDNHLIRGETVTALTLLNQE